MDEGDKHQVGRTSGIRDVSRRVQAGWTLIELLVVIVIVGILASLSLPAFQGYLLEGRLDSDKPILMEIAPKQRMRKNEKGK